jgi:hypothetical protein
MPNAKDNAKLTGDTHLPDIDEGLEGGPDDASRAEGSNSDAGRPGRDENAAGFVKDKDLGGGSQRGR